MLRPVSSPRACMAVSVSVRTISGVRPSSRHRRAASILSAARRTNTQGNLEVNIEVINE